MNKIHCQTERYLGKMVKVLGKSKRSLKLNGICRNENMMKLMMDKITQPNEAIYFQKLRFLRRWVSDNTAITIENPTKNTEKSRSAKSIAALNDLLLKTSERNTAKKARIAY
ncbi:MAG: hypothetical protein IKA95_03630 [Clostridia bacterium]|nr:hypothetical protein [Clostridia bacterium]